MGDVAKSLTDNGAMCEIRWANVMSFYVRVQFTLRVIVKIWDSVTNSILLLQIHEYCQCNKYMNMIGTQNKLKYRQWLANKNSLFTPYMVVPLEW